MLQDWRDAILVPFPKKGNLCCCDNWQGIALHDIVGKLVARIVQNSLQQLVEGELLELQCEFGRGHNCRHNFYGVAID